MNFFRIFLNFYLGIFESVTYILQLRDYYANGDIVYGILSTMSLVLYTIYAIFLTILEAKTIIDSALCSIILGIFLGSFQLGHFFALCLAYSGRGSILRLDDTRDILDKMELWKIAIFSMPQGSLALYLAILNADQLDISFKSAQTG